MTKGFGRSASWVLAVAAAFFLTFSLPCACKSLSKCSQFIAASETASCCCQKSATAGSCHSELGKTLAGGACRCRERNECRETVPATTPSRPQLNVFWIFALSGRDFAAEVAEKIFPACVFKSASCCRTALELCGDLCRWLC